MAAFNFPSNPNLNDTHTENGVTFRWNGTVWRRVGDVGAQGAQGLQGEQGATGTGNQGVQGAQGEQGSQGVQGSQGFQGAQGFQGVQGAGGVGTQGSQGAQGFQGIQGADGNFGGATFDYTFDNGTANADPGQGRLRFDTNTISAVTHLYIDDEDDNGTDITSFLATIDDSTSTIKGHYRVSNRLDASDYALFTISSVTDNVGYFEVTSSFVSGSASSFTNGEDIIITFARTGDKGDTGNQGVQGAQGFQGRQGASGGEGGQGFQGEQGAQGLQGLQGRQGALGAQGNTGSQGVQGAPGTGNQGFQGRQGAQGTQGVQGATGQQGAQGEQGAASTVAGPQGFQGHQGSQGFQGATGAAADQGDKGGLRYTFVTNTGANSTSAGQVRFNNATFASITSIGIHNTDADGIDQETYINTWDDGGSANDKGIVIIKSNTNGDATFATFRITATNNATNTAVRARFGVTPLSGSIPSNNEEIVVEFIQKGDTGAQGAQGSQGAQGAQGLQGHQGRQGSQGEQGATGNASTVAGPQGEQGASGPQGFQGRQGAAGGGGSPGGTGPQGEQGFQGRQGSPGGNGSPGGTGPQGFQGRQGSPGGSGSPGGTGPQGVQGAQGRQGTAGGSGSPGGTGPQGLQGRQGAAGTDGGEANPYGGLAAYSSSNQGTITWDESNLALRLQSSSDSTIGVAFPAFRVNVSDNVEQYSMSVKIKSNTTSSSGVYIRIYEYHGALPDGKLAVSNSATNSLVQEDSSGKTNWYENSAVSTSWSTKTYDYTPHASAQWASIVVLNWSGLGSNSLYIRDPSYQLKAPGSVVVAATTDSTCYPILSGTNTAGRKQTLVGDQFTFNESNGDFTATGNVTAYSDINLKENIEIIENALEKVSSINGITYTRKDTGAKETGVIAQEVEQVIPEAVREVGKDPTYKAVAYGNLVGLLIEAIKELKTEIEELKNKK